MLPHDPKTAKLVGRVWRQDVGGLAVVLCRDGNIVDVTQDFPTMTDLLNAEPTTIYDELSGENLGKLEDFLHAPKNTRPGSPNSCLIAPCDLQALKACGVTFAQSMIEQVIDERTEGDAGRADELRKRVGEFIGGTLSNIKVGSAQAQDVKQAFMAEGLWSQYLEVGIGPDAEVFTKSQPMSAVDYGAEVGVNLQDVEGRSALLFAKAKDNNASCSVGPFIRLFDDEFTMQDIETANLSMKVTGTDGFEMNGLSNMSEISCAPADLASRTCGPNHQYPDGFMLFTGTMFAPTQDRGAPGSGFTHELGDVVDIKTDRLGTLSNTVTKSDMTAPSTFGSRALMMNLANRGILK